MIDHYVSVVCMNSCILICNLRTNDNSLAGEFLQLDNSCIKKNLLNWKI